MTSTRPVRLHLSKHHAAGNDFLVLLDPGDDSPIDGALAAALCDRRRGVGADGVIRAVPDGADLRMELRNADGGVAETSGNGLRCLAQAAVDARLVPGGSVRVHTAAGVRIVDLRPDADGTAGAWVDMGRPELGAEEDFDAAAGPSPAACKLARWVDVGNPHLVLVGPDPAGCDVAGAGAALSARRPGGANVEFVAVEPGGDVLRMRVWERGVGETPACGSGSVAAAAVTRAAALSADRVTVESPGGALEVVWSGERARLGGPVHRVADLDLEVAVLMASSAR